MAIQRTPAASFHTDVSFIENGELGSQDVLNRPLFSLDDKLQYLKNTQDTEITSGQKLASLVGEAYPASTGVPVWVTPTNFVQGATHHAAIEALDNAVSQINVSSGSTRINNIDTFLIGEDSTTGTAPDWSTARTPFSVQLGDTHHAAINRLDISVSGMKASVTQAGSRLVVQTGSITKNKSQLALANTNIGAIQTELNAVSVLTATHATNITNLQASDVTIQTELNAASLMSKNVSTLLDKVRCVQVKVQSQINLVRADAAHTQRGAMGSGGGTTDFWGCT